MSILEGPLNSATIQSVLEVLVTRNPASTWLISDGRDEKVIYFSTGGIRLYSSAGRGISSLEDHLIQSRLVSPEQIQIARQSVQENRRESLDEALERLEFLTRGRFQEAMDRLIYLELCDVVPWENAIFEFYEGNPPPQIFDQKHPALFARLDVRDLATRIREWNQEWSLLKSKLYSERLRVRRLAGTEKAGEDKPFTGNRKLLRAIDGNRTLREIALASACDFPGVAREIREGLRRGALRGTVAPARDPTTPSEVLEEIERLEEALDKAINTILIHKRIAVGYEKIQENDLASDHYHILGNLEADAGRVFKAVEHYRRALALSPQNLDVHESLIRRLQDWGEDDKALEEITGYAKKLFNFGFLQRAFDVLHGVAAKIIHLFDVRILLGDILRGLGREEEALKEYLDVAREKKRSGATDGIEELYRKILSVSPANREARSGLVHERRRRIGKALVWVHRFSAAAAGILLVLWISCEGLARSAWAKTEEPLRRSIDGKEYWRGIEMLWDVGKRYPSALLSSTFLAKEMDLFKLAFYRREDDLERASRLKDEGRFPEARDVFQSVLESTDPIEPQLKRAGEGLRGAEALGNESSDLRRNAEFFLNAGAYEDAFVFSKRILEKFPETAEGLRVPFCIRSTPSGAEVRINGMLWGRTPLWIVVPYKKTQEILVQLKGYRPQDLQVWVNLRSPSIEVKLKKS